MNKKIAVSFSSVMSVIAILAAIFFRDSETYTKERSSEDLTYIIQKVKENHISAIDKIPIPTQKQYDQEVKQLKENESLEELWRAASRITATLKDAHTRVENPKEKNSIFDVRYFFEKDDLFIEVGEKKYQVVKINKIPFTELYQSAKRLISYENEFGLKFALTEYLRSPAYCQLLGIKPHETQQLECNDNGEIKIFESPLKLNLSSARMSFIRFKIDSRSRIGILTLDSCQNNDFYKRTLKEFFSQVKGNKIQSIAIDLRENEGGDSKCATEFIKYLPCKKFRDYSCLVRENNLMYNFGEQTTKNNPDINLRYYGKVYVLTSNKTFSSATMFSVLLRDNKLAKVIGEPSSNKPSSFGDVVEFTLPNSGLKIRITYKKFMRPDQDKNEEDHQVPDYKISAHKAIEKFLSLSMKK